MSVTSSIQLRRGTGASVPSSLLEGELAINTDTGHLYYGSSGTSNVVSSSIGATRLFATEEIRLGGAPGTTSTGSISKDQMTFRNDVDENLNFQMNAGTPELANSASFLTSENGFGIIIDKDDQHPDRVFFVGHNNTLPGISNYAPLMEISESGATKFFGDITASGEISASGELTSHLLRFKEGADSYIRHTDDLGVNIKANNSRITFAGDITASGHISASSITSSGDISASGDINASTFSSNNLTLATITGTENRIQFANRPTLVQGQLTASAISSSEFVTANDFRIAGAKFAEHHGNNVFNIGTDGASHLNLTNITSSGVISCSAGASFVGQIFSASNDNINESERSNEYFHLVQNAQGKVQQDIRVKVLKITGQRMSRIGSRPYTVFDAPGADKAIQISEIILFVKHSSGTGANFPSNGNPERNKLNFYAIPNDGVGASVVPMGAFNRNVVNNSQGRSTVVAKHIPVSQMRLAVNGAVKLRYGRSSGTSAVSIETSGSDATLMGAQDYFFKIKYRIVDISKDFTAVHTVEGTGTSDTPITP